MGIKRGDANVRAGVHAGLTPYDDNPPLLVVPDARRMGCSQLSRSESDAVNELRSRSWDT